MISWPGCDARCSSRDFSKTPLQPRLCEPSRGGLVPVQNGSQSRGYNMTATPQTGLHGHLDLVCAPDDLGQSVLASQSFRAPMHLSKPWREGGTLVVNVVNQTAGLLSGDRIDTRVRVETGASLLLTTPSASRAHPTPGGRIELHQHFSIASGARLEVFPEMFIPHAGTTCSQHTRIEIEPGGELLWIDVLAPGRVAMGESFAYQRLDWRTDIFLGDRPIVRERSPLAPDQPNLAALRKVFPNAYYGTIYWISEIGLEAVREALLALQSDTLWIGVSRLVAGGWTIKILAADSPAMRACVKEVRRLIYEPWQIPQPDLRKI